MTTPLRQLLTATHVDQNGRAVVYADRVAAAIVARDDLVDRLILDLARASGATESAVRARLGLGVPGTANEARRPLNGAHSAHSDHQQATQRTPGGDR